MTPLKDRVQQVLTPVQQLEMRAEIQKCKSLGEVIRVVDRFIFDRDHDGDVDAIEPAIIKDRSFHHQNYDFWYLNSILCCLLQAFCYHDNSLVLTEIWLEEGCEVNTDCRLCFGLSACVSNPNQLGLG